MPYSVLFDIDSNGRYTHKCIETEQQPIFIFWIHFGFMEFIWLDTHTHNHTLPYAWTYGAMTIDAISFACKPYAFNPTTHQYMISVENLYSTLNSTHLNDIDVSIHICIWKMVYVYTHNCTKAVAKLQNPARSAFWIIHKLELFNPLDSILFAVERISILDITLRFNHFHHFH